VDDATFPPAFALIDDRAVSVRVRIVVPALEVIVTVGDVEALSTQP
jgi:hypothetical protein